MSIRSNFILVRSDEDAYVISDVGPWDEFMTITNDAERVVDHCLPRMQPGQRLLYYDSEGDLGELIIKNGMFSSFGLA